MAVELREEQEKDDNVDILTQLTNYVDNHLRVFRVRKERIVK